MSVKSDKNLEEVLRGRLENHEMPHGRPLFDTIYRKVNEEPVKKDNRFWWYAAAAVSLLAFATVLFLAGPFRATEQVAHKNNPGNKTETLVKPENKSENAGLETPELTAVPEHKETQVPVDKQPVKSVETVAFVSSERNLLYRLPDSSVIYLERGSKLEFEEGFGKTHRNLSFHGKAFFEVQKNKALPFVINTGKSLTEVTGTSFNLVSLPGHEELNLVTGKVNYSIPGEKPVALVAGMEAEITDGKIVTAESKNQNFLAWKTGKMKFEKTPVSEVIQVIEEYVGSEIVIADKEILSCPYTGKFEKKSADNVMNVFALTLGATVERKGDKFIVSGGSCK
jgi:hypothetical protein